MKILTTLLVLSALCLAGVAQAQTFTPKLTLQWQDKSGDETGFSIERRLSTTGSFVEIATVAANVTTYIDTVISAATIYCYRLYAFNMELVSDVWTRNPSGYSAVVCGSSVAAPATPTDLILAAQTQAAVTKQSLTGAQTDLAKARSTNSHTTRANAINAAQSKVNAAQKTLLIVTNKMIEAQQKLAVQE